MLCSALDDLQGWSAEYFGAGNVSSGMAMGIGSVGRKEGEAWAARLEEFSTTCDGVVGNFGKKLSVGEGFVTKKSGGVSRATQTQFCVKVESMPFFYLQINSWGERITRRFDKLTNGKK